MKMPDVNVLVYAHRAEDPVHARYREWVEAAVNGPEPLAISSLVAGAFVRLVTNPRVFPNPTPLPIALACMDDLLANDNVRLVSPGPRHWSVFGALCRATSATGSRAADAQHAAVAIENGCTFVTRDRDFAAFAAHGLSWMHLV